MKRLLASFLLFAITVALAGCGDNTKPGGPPGGPPPPPPPGPKLPKDKAPGGDKPLLPKGID